VIATGGGTFALEANRQVICQLGISVFLDVPWPDVLRRLPGKQEERPVFGTPEQAEQLYRARLPFYRTADIQVRPEPSEPPEAIAGRIEVLLGRRR
jgi:shikimate kinase